MEKRSFKGEESVSLLGFGTMRLPVTDPDTQEINIQETEEMLEEAIRHGVNYFDTAFPYHFGRSETVVGEILLAYPRSSFYLADKMPIWQVQSSDDVERIFQRQLEKCKVEYFDFYLLHNLSRPKLPKIEAMKAYEYLARQKEEGKIHRLGFSFHDNPEALEEILARYDWDFTQIQLNYFDWEVLNAKRLYEILTERGLPVAVMEPVRGGALATLCPESIEILKTAAPERSIASWALRFAASLPNVYTVLSGMSSREQTLDNLQTFDSFTPLSETERTTIARALDAYHKASSIPCTGCRYCMDCPNGVDIPRNFAIYNRWLANKNQAEFLNAYFSLGEEKQASQCVECGLCREKCPQKIDIPDLMSGISADYQGQQKPDWFA